MYSVLQRGTSQYSIIPSILDYLFEDQFPTSFRVEAVSALALRATWVASEYNCDLLGYKVRYNDGIGGSGEVVVDDPNSGTVLIEGLSAGTNYAVGLVPYNTIQDFPMYGETNIYTLPLSCKSDLSKVFSQIQRHPSSTQFQTNFFVFSIFSKNL